MASRNKLSTYPPTENATSLALKYEALLRGMERQKETARDMALRARQMYDQALKMREQGPRTSLP